MADEFESQREFCCVRGPSERRVAYRVRQGRCPSHPPCRQDPGRHLRPRRRSAPRVAAGARVHQRHQARRRERAAHPRHSRAASSWPSPRRSSATRIKGIYEHVDLLAVRRGEKVTIDVPLSIVGDVVPGGLLQQENTSVSVEAEATHLPTEIEVCDRGPGDRLAGHRGRPDAARGRLAGRRPRPDAAAHLGGADRGGARGRRRRVGRAQTGCRRAAWLRRASTARRRVGPRQPSLRGPGESMPDDSTSSSVSATPGRAMPPPGTTPGFFVVDLLAERVGGSVQGPQVERATSSRDGWPACRWCWPSRVVHERVGWAGGRPGPLLQGAGRADHRRPRRTRSALRNPAAQARWRRRRPQRAEVDRYVAGQQGVRPRAVRASGARPDVRTRPTTCCASSPRAERKELPFLVDRAADAVEALLTEGLEAAQNEYNRLTAVEATSRRERQSRVAPTVRLLVGEQPPFGLDAAAVAGQRSVRADHPVARHDDRDRVAAVGQPDRPRRRRVPDGRGGLAVAGRLAVRDRPAAPSRPAAGTASRSGAAAGRTSCRSPAKYSASWLRTSSKASSSRVQDGSGCWAFLPVGR